MYLDLQALKDDSCGRICDTSYQLIPHDKLTEIEGKVDVTTMYACCRSMLLTHHDRALQVAFTNQANHTPISADCTIS